MLDDEIQQWAERLQPHISYCENCQPYDNGEAFWILGIERDLEELFDENEVPLGMRDKIAERLHCLNCGSQLERYDSYGEKTQQEKKIDENYHRWIGRYHGDLQDFVNYIEKYPYLAANHKMGRKIIETMPSLPRIQISESNWFRGRSIKDGRILSPDAMRAPDPSKVQINEGRFNHFGQSHWYLANTKAGAAEEVLVGLPGEEMLWMQEIVIHSASDILDIRAGFTEPDLDLPLLATGLIYYSYTLNKVVDKNKFWKPEYFVPRFVADAAKAVGHQGIIFTSVRNYSDNLVLFDVSRIKFEFINGPYIYEVGISPDDDEERTNPYDKYRA